jgi:hypothetical protein
VTTSRLVPFMLGAISALSLVAALFFARFYRDTREPLFLYFAAAFGLEGVNRTLQAFTTAAPNEVPPTVLVLRAIAYSLIVVGVYRKNRS